MKTALTTVVEWGRHGTSLHATLARSGITTTSNSRSDGQQPMLTLMAVVDNRQSFLHNGQESVAGEVAIDGSV